MRAVFIWKPQNKIQPSGTKIFSCQLSPNLDQNQFLQYHKALKQIMILSFFLSIDEHKQRGKENDKVQ